MERVIRSFDTPEEAQAAIREEYRTMTPNERVADFTVPVTIVLGRAP